MRQLALGSWGPPPLRPELSQWHTPATLAATMARWAGCGPGVRVLEPSAGGGALVGAAARLGANVTAIEIDPDWLQYARESNPDLQPLPEYWLGDFLSMEPEPFDVVLMNPPFEGGLEQRFVVRALAWAPRVVTLLRTHALHGVERLEQLWRYVYLTRLAVLVRRPAFDASGGGARHEFCVAELMSPSTSPTTLGEGWVSGNTTEWWGQQW